MPIRKPRNPRHSDTTAARKGKRRVRQQASFGWRLYRSVPVIWRLFRRTARGGVGAVRWWWGLPRWLKWGKLVIIVLLAAGIPMAGTINEWLTYRRIYNEYYDHFYNEYSRTLIKTSYAAYYANYYADYYAKYYSSPAYRAALAYALPSATADNLSFPADSRIAGLHINQNGLKLIKYFEGLSLEPYRDSGGKLTIGYGHLIKPGEYFSTISEPQAEALLKSDVQVAEAFVKRYVTVQLNANQFAALVSLVYNIGPGNFKSSTLLEYLNGGDSARAAQEFLRWDKVNGRTIRGLSRRRASEKQLFEG